MARSPGRRPVRRSVRVASFALAVLLPGLAIGAGEAGSPQVTPPVADTGALRSTPVPPESWQGVAERLALSLVSAQVRAEEEPLFLPGAQVRQFGRSAPSSPASLRDRFDGWTIVSVQAFEYPKGALASGLATDVGRLRQAEPALLPALAARILNPPADQRAGADETARRWVGAALSPSQGQKVALLTLWNPGEANRPVLERLAFLLVKSDRLPDGRWRVEAVRYGSAQDAVLEGY